MDDALDDIRILRKVVLEGFELVFEGQYKDAAKVFLLMSRVKPGNRGCELGLALVKFILSDLRKRDNFDSLKDPDDPFMGCIHAIKLIQLGRVAEAKDALAKVRASGDEPSVRLADVIMAEEVDEGKNHAGY